MIQLVDATQDQLLEDVLDYIVASGVEFKTFSEAYEYHKNILDYGEFDEEADQMSFSISTDGIVGGYETAANIMPVNTVTSAVAPGDFSKGHIHYCRISHSNRMGFPEETQGLLITNTMGFTSGSWNIFQEYHMASRNTIYRRTAIGLDWGDGNRST